MFAGFFAPFHGFGFLVRRRHLWRYAIVPLVLNVALVVAAGWAWMHFVVPWVAGLIPGGEGWIATSGRFLARLIVYVVTLPLALGVYVVAALVVGGPFYEALCERVEREVLGGRFEEPLPRPFWRIFADGVRVGLGNLVVAILGGVVALLCPIVVPGFGAVLSVVIGWFLAGFSFVAYPFDWRGVNLLPKVGIAFRHLPTTLGVGLAVSLMLVPIITLPLAAPCAVVGAALLFPGGTRRGRG